MILVDTSVWIEFFKGTNSVHQKALHEFIQNEEDISITEIIITEILQGIKSNHDYTEVKKYILEFPIYKPSDTQTYIIAANIYRACRNKGKTIRKTIDCIIAAICIENNLPIFHKDTDFDIISNITDLKVLKI